MYLIGKLMSSIITEKLDAFKALYLKNVLRLFYLDHNGDSIVDLIIFSYPLIPSLPITYVYSHFSLIRQGD